MSEESDAVVICAGARQLQVGFAGDDAPRLVTVNSELTTKTHALGYDGHVNDWKTLEQEWSRALSDLHVPLDAFKAIVSERVFFDASERRRKLEWLLEEQHLNAVSFSTNETLAMFASGRTTGVGVAVGWRQTCVVPVLDGYALPVCSAVVDVGGGTVTQELARLLAERDVVDLREGVGLQVARAIKETRCVHVVADRDPWPRTEGGVSESWEYEMPDGSSITVPGDVRDLAVDPLVQPLPEAVLGAIVACDKSLERDMFRNIVVSGGGSMTQGFSHRLAEGIDVSAGEVLSCGMCAGVIAPPERKYSVWIGGSILGSLPSFDLYLTREMYEECGVSAIARMFLL